MDKVQGAGELNRLKPVGATTPKLLECSPRSLMGRESVFSSPRFLSNSPRLRCPCCVPVSLVLPAREGSGSRLRVACLGPDHLTDSETLP